MQFLTESFIEHHGMALQQNSCAEVCFCDLLVLWHNCFALPLAY